MSSRGFPSAGIGIACVVAGPVFLCSTALAHMYLQLPSTILVEWELVVGFILFLLPTVMVGCLVAFFPTFFGSLLMHRLGQVAEVARSSVSWILAGAAAGAAIAYVLNLFGEPQAMAFVVGVTATGAMCAAICRRFAWWE